MMVLSARLNNFREEQCGGRRDGDLCVADKPRVPVRDHGIGKKLQVCVIGKRNSLALRRIIGVHRMDLGCRLGGEVHLRARTKGDVQSEPVSLQQAARGSDQEHVGKTRHLFVAMQRALHHVGSASLQVCQDRFAGAVLETQTEETRLAHSAAAHLRRLILERGEFRHRYAERFSACPGRKGGRYHAERRARGLISNRNSRSISATNSGTPSPVLQFVNRNGLLPRIISESCFITSRLAPTWGARSVLLITSMSEYVIPGPFLRGILSPAATSIT